MFLWASDSTKPPLPPLSLHFPSTLSTLSPLPFSSQLVCPPAPPYTLPSATTQRQLPTCAGLRANTRKSRPHHLHPHQEPPPTGHHIPCHPTLFSTHPRAALHPLPLICYCLTLRQSWWRGKAAAAPWCTMRVMSKDLLRNGNFTGRIFFLGVFPRRVHTYTVFTVPLIS